MGGFYKLTDSELLALLKQDDIDAFNELYVRYWKKLHGEVYKRLKSKESAEELVQEIFTNLWLKRHSLQITETVGGYLHSTLSNRVIDLYRKELVKVKYQESLRIIHSEADNSTEDAIMLRELTHTVEAEVSQLPEKCRRVYQLSRNECKNNKEIARELGISEKTVENHLTKALRRLRIGLSHYITIIIVLLLK